MLPGNKGLCWPKAAGIEEVLGKPYVCGPPAVNNLSKLAECRQAFESCALEPAAAGKEGKASRSAWLAGLRRGCYSLSALVD